MMLLIGQKPLLCLTSQLLTPDFLTKFTKPPMSMTLTGNTNFCYTLCIIDAGSSVARDAINRPLYIFQRQRGDHYILQVSK